MATREKLPDSVHTILKSALAASRPEDRPLGPWHTGGPRPVCPVRTQIGLAHALARRFTPSLAPTHRHAFENTLAAVEAWMDGKADASALRSLADQKPGKDVVYALAMNVAGAAATLARGKPDLVSSAVQAAAAKAVGLTPDGEETRALLHAIDQTIICGECEAAFHAAKHLVRVDRVLWRGADEKGKVAHLVARLSDGRFAALSKLVARKAPAWVEGLPDDAVAVLPESSFKVAAPTVMRYGTLPSARLHLAWG